MRADEYIINHKIDEILTSKQIAIYLGQSLSPKGKPIITINQKDFDNITDIMNTFGSALTRRAII